ncbi:D-alanyl-D-alanine carboxypeptidase family protein [Qipengyuania gaetbuli]|uniref:D-alanyl-D-alanine carboxypeptidase family protein n=1 Tax=Qipengyuania gaetbuli TaxID=266952 RepID=UPI003899C60F
MRKISRFALIPSFALLFAGQASAQDRQPAGPPNANDAPIAFLLDLTSGQVLFAREADRRFMPASITKVMTTFLAFEWMEEGKILPQQVVTVRPELWRKWRGVGSTMFLASGARVTMDDLVHGVTTVSANDGAAVLAEGAAGSVDAWVAAMNAKASEIGMRDSHFGTPNGWMDDGRTFVTARDLSTLAAALIRKHPTKYRHFVGQTEFTYNEITQPNHDPISGKVPGADGIKTGFTNQAGYGFLGSAQRNGRRLVMVVAGAPRARVRDRASRALLEWGFRTFDQQQFFAPGTVLGEADVQGGDSGSVRLVARRGVFLSMPKNHQGKVSMTIRYDGPLRAPVATSEKIAELLVQVEGLPEYSVPLVAEEAVEEAGFFDRVINGVRGWLR